MKKIISGCIVLFVGLIWISAFAYLYSEYKMEKLNDYPLTQLHFSIQLHEKTIENERGSFYYDTGEGFVATQVVVFPYDQTVATEVKQYVINIPTKKPIHKLRFDPLEEKGKLTISEFQVIKHITREVPFKLDTLKSSVSGSIEEISLHENNVTITSSGHDPNILLISDFRQYEKK